MSDINIIPIGSGSTGNSFFIEILDRSFLIDMGMGYRLVTKSLEKNGRKMEDIEAIFVTHGHNDHVKACVAIGNHTDCTVYADSSAMYPIRDMKNEKKDIILNEEFEALPGLYVKPFGVPHDYYRTVGYVFRNGDRKISYVTDCGKMSDRIIDEIKGSDVIIIEANHDIEMLKSGPYPIFLKKRILSEHGHLSNDECAETIKSLYEAGTRNFILAHLSRHNNTPEKALETVEEKMKDKDIFLYACREAADEMLSFD